MKNLVALLCLFLLLVLVPRAVMNPDASNYDPMSDVNRDKTIDVHDLSRLGKAYGSTQTIPTQPGKTTIYVYQLETDPPQVEDARVAIIDPNYGYPGYQASHVEYTDSLGLASFTLTPNKNCTAIAWSETTYNYANFTTNSLGEASVAIRLGHPHLPPDWVTVTLVNKSSGELWQEPVAIASVGELVYTHSSDLGWVFAVVFINVFSAGPFNGIFVIGPWGVLPNPINEPSKSYFVSVENPYGALARPAYTPDENGNANVIVYV